MAIDGKDKSDAYERGQKWAKETDESDYNPINIRPIGRSVVNSSEDNRAIEEAFDAGVDNYNETIARHKADSFSFVPESWIKDRSSDIGNTSSRNNGSSGDSPTNYTSDYNYSSSPPSSSSSSTSNTDNSDRNIIIYLGLVAGAFFFIGKVTTWTLAWWICVVLILTGIPIYIVLAYIAFWVSVACLVLAIIIMLVRYFIQNPY